MCGPGCESADGDATWYGAAGYARLDLATRLALAARGEWFADPDGIRTGTAQRLWEVTLATALGIARGPTFRIELRYDHSDEAVFPAQRHAAISGDGSCERPVRAVRMPDARVTRATLAAPGVGRELRRTRSIAE